MSASRLIERVLCWLNRPRATDGYCRSCGDTVTARREVRASLDAEKPTTAQDAGPLASREQGASDGTASPRPSRR